MNRPTKLKRKKWLWPLLIGVGMIALCNLPAPSDTFELWVDYNHYKYSNGDGTLKFTENLFKNDRFHFTRTITWPGFFKKYPNGDTIIYRNFTKTRWHFGGMASISSIGVIRCPTSAVSRPWKTGG